MLIQLKKEEYIKHKRIAKIAVLFGCKFLIRRFLISSDKSRISKECLCDRCNTIFKGSYGVGYYSCKNADRWESF